MSKGVGEMVRSRSVQVKASAGTEGARRATGVPADGAAGEAGPLAPGQRGSVGRKRDVVLRLLRGESLEALSREVGVEIYRLEDWRDRAVAGLERGVQARQGDLVAETLDAATRHIGELSMENERLRERCGGRGDERHALRGHGAPRRDPARVSGVGALALGALRPADTRAAAAHGRGARAAGSDAHGVGRDAAGGDSGRSRPLAVPGRGPSDGPRAAADLGRDPGRADAGARVLRAHKLLSPHRGRQGAARVHAGTIVTQAPNVMWGTDGGRVFTLDDGWGWIFTAVEHWNAECVGWHVCKVGSRFAALEPIAQGLRRIYGALDADSARGLALRMDHGSQYLSDHFLNQIRYWGIRPSYGFVEEPETNGVAERWNRTLKEQAIHGRIFQNLKEVRAAVTACVERYNTTWRLEKLGYHTPIEAREAHELRRAA